MAGSRIPGPLGADPQKAYPTMPAPLGLNDSAKQNSRPGFAVGTPGPLGVGDYADPSHDSLTKLSIGETLMMAKPPHFPQGALTCWASAIASWQRAKGLDQNITDRTLINHYKGTSCVDDSGALTGQANVEAIYAEWRVLLSISAEIDEPKFTFQFVKDLINNHGHFIIASGSKDMMHSMVVYGARWDDTSDKTAFTLFVEDPMASDNEKNRMFIEFPIRLGLGTERSAGPAPCSKKTTAAP